MASPVRSFVSIDLPAPFDAPGVFEWLAARAIGGVESAFVPSGGFDALRFARTLRLPGGPGALEIQALPLGIGAYRLDVTTQAASQGDDARMVAAVRRLLDVDAPVAQMNDTLAGDPHLGPLIAANPGMRMPGTVDAGEYLIRAIVGQQISVAAARTHLGRMAERIGAAHTPGLAGETGLTRLFPTAAAIASRVPVATPGTPEASDPDRPLRLPARVVASVVAAARALEAGASEAGELLLDAERPRESRASLASLPGVGPWTVEYMAMRVLRDRDAWPIGDVALLKGARAAGLPLPEGASPSRLHRALAEHAERWRPYRSHAALHLWAASLQAS